MVTLNQAIADANSGNAEAQYALSQYYARQNSSEQARHWLERAAAQGLPAANYSLAQWLLASAKGLPDIVNVEQLLRRSMEQHIGAAGSDIAKTILMREQPLSQLLPLACDQLQIAAKQGHAAALRQLAMLRTEHQQQALLGSAAALGDALASHLLTIPYQTGRRPTATSKNRILSISNFASARECAYSIAYCKPLLRPSFIIDPKTGLRRPDPVRRSSGAVLDVQSTDVVCFALMRRVAEQLNLAWQRCEPVNVLRYLPGDEYRLHHDTFEHDPLQSAQEANGTLPLNQRSDTALLYLNDVVSGGETEFPRLSERVTPELGKLCHFENIKSGKPDPNMIHAGCVVNQGEKWLMTLWFRQHPLLSS